MPYDPTAFHYSYYQAETFDQLDTLGESIFTVTGAAALNFGNSGGQAARIPPTTFTNRAADPTQKIKISFDFENFNFDALSELLINFDYHRRSYTGPVRIISFNKGNESILSLWDEGTTFGLYRGTTLIANSNEETEYAPLESTWQALQVAVYHDTEPYSSFYLNISNNIYGANPLYVDSDYIGCPDGILTNDDGEWADSIEFSSGPGSTVSVDNFVILDFYFTQPLEVVRMLPATDDGPNQWTPSTGSSHCAMVNDRRIRDLTNYLSCTAAGQIEEFTVIPTPDSPFISHASWLSQADLFQFFLVVKVYGLSANTIRTYVKQSDNTVSYGATRVLNGFHQDIMGPPDTANTGGYQKSAWEVTELNDIKVGLECVDYSGTPGLVHYLTVEVIRVAPIGLEDVAYSQRSTCRIFSTP